MSCCGSTGLFGRIAFDLSAVPSFFNFTGASLALPLVQGGSNLMQSEAIVSAEEGGSNGQTGENSEMARLGLKTVKGGFNLAMTPVSFDYFGPLILGGAWGASVPNQSGVALTSFPTTLGPGSFHALLHTDSHLSPFFDLRTNQFTIGSSVGEFVKMTFETLGVQRDTMRLGSLWPSSLVTSTSVPYMHEDIIMRVNGTEYGIRSWQVTYNNSFAPRFYGKRTACSIERSGRAKAMVKIVVGKCVDTMANIFEAGRAPSSLNVEFIFTHPNAGVSARIVCPGVQFPQDDPAVTGPGEILLDLNGTARRKGGAPEISFYSDAS